MGIGTSPPAIGHCTSNGVRKAVRPVLMSELKTWVRGGRGEGGYVAVSKTLDNLLIAYRIFQYYFVLVFFMCIFVFCRILSQDFFGSL